ncbi:hypothetical protein AFCDBAGC_4619 [Methylobacterium cerastii]|uniref:Uncharacterized protein n=1 Tax=Methylobacterium cerastii TaxID=932741 RepID=A0ABQ4QPJ2_9HYPH|nr:hypothetical protein AFCDBAGC_4619 [Methylobacterium cerastii]
MAPMSQSVFFSGIQCLAFSVVQMVISQITPRIIPAVKVANALDEPNSWRLVYNQR